MCVCVCMCVSKGEGEKERLEITDVVSVYYLEAINRSIHK